MERPILCFILIFTVLRLYRAHRANRAAVNRLKQMLYAIASELQLGWPVPEPSPDKRGKMLAKYCWMSEGRYYMTFGPDGAIVALQGDVLILPPTALLGWTEEAITVLQKLCTRELRSLLHH